MNNPIEAITLASQDRTGLATSTGIGQLRYILAGLTADTQQTRFYDIADSLAERLPNEDERFILFDERSEKEKLDYNQVMNLLFKFGIFPSRNEIDLAYPLGFFTPYDFLDLLKAHNEQRGGIEINPILDGNNQSPHTKLGIKSSFPGVVIHIVHNELVLNNVWPHYQAIPSLHKLGIARIELAITPQAYELPQP